MSASVDETLDVNLTPLLDLVLQLIMFFMITVNFVRVDQFDVVERCREDVEDAIAAVAMELRRQLHVVPIRVLVLIVLVGVIRSQLVRT